MFGISLIQLHSKNAVSQPLIHQIPRTHGHTHAETELYPSPSAAPLWRRARAAAQMTPLRRFGTGLRQ